MPQPDQTRRDNHASAAEFSTGGMLLKLILLPGLVVLAFIIAVLSFAALGVLLGAVLPNTRAAQGLGMMLFFVVLILGGAGPPREVLNSAMQFIGDATPLRHAIIMLQDPWLGFGWNTSEFLVVAGIMVVSSLLSVRFFRWD